jgi:HK97 family phage major capsid protein
MGLAPRVALGPNGVSIPVDLGGIEPEWVDEAGEKTKTETDLGLRSMHPKKLAAIVVVSQEVVRSNPGGFVTSLYPKFAAAFARAFDMAAMYGLSASGHSTGPFDVDLADTSNEVTLGTGTTYYNDLVSVGKTLSVNGNSLNGWALSDYFYWQLMDELDGNNRPIFSPDGDTNGVLTSGKLIGLPASFSPMAGFEHHYGFGGDFTKCAWGAIGGINYSVSSETAVTIGGTLTSLWEKNLVAIRAEAEYGFVVANTTASHFVKIHTTGDVGTLGTPDVGGFGTL